MKNTIRLILIFLFILATIMTSDFPTFGQISNELIYKTDRPGFLVNDDKIIISEDYVDVVLEPIPGKVTRWKITREEEAPPVIEPVVTIVNNTELTYTGTWDHPSGTWGDISHSSTPGATAKYSFTGKHIDVFGTFAAHHGILEYKINEGITKSVNLYSPTRQDGVLIISEPVPAGLNTITFTVVDKTVLIDYLKIQRQ